MHVYTPCRCDKLHFDALNVVGRMRRDFDDLRHGRNRRTPSLRMPGAAPSARECIRHVACDGELHCTVPQLRELSWDVAHVQSESLIRMPSGLMLTGWHRHDYDYVVVPLFDGTLEIDLGKGERIIAQMQNGVPYYRDLGNEHDVINNNDFECVFVEMELIEPKS